MYFSEDKFTKIIENLSKQLEACEKVIDKIISNFKSNLPNLKVAPESITFLGEKANDYYFCLFKHLDELKTGNLVEYAKDCKPTLENKSAELGNQLEQLKTKKDFVETSLDNILPRLQEYKSNVVDKITVAKKSGAKPTKIQSCLKSVTHEIDFLKKLYSTTEVSEHKIKYALETSMGIIGQCCRDIKDSDPDELVHQYVNTLLGDCINYAIEVRNHHIMHNATTGDQDKISDLSHNWLLPLQRDFEALKIAGSTTQNLVELSAVFTRLGKYDTAEGILQECSKRIADGEILNPIDYEKLSPQTEEQERIIEIYKLVDTLCPENIKADVVARAYNSMEGIEVLRIRLDCQLSQQNFPAAVKTSDELIALLSTARDSCLLKPIPGLAPGVLEYIDSKLIYCRVQKAFAFDNMGHEKEACKLLIELKNDFENGRFNKIQHAEILSRIYIDLAYHDNSNIIEYIRAIESLLDYGTVVTKFNYLHIKFQISQDGNEKEELLNSLKSCFADNVGEFRAKLGLSFFDFAMKVKLCELQG